MSLDRSLGMLFFICFLPLIPQGSFGRVSSAQSLAVSYPLVSRKGVIREAVSAFEPAAAPVETCFDKLQETEWHGFWMNFHAVISGNFHAVIAGRVDFCLIPTGSGMT